MQKRNYQTVEFPRSRIATFDIGAVGIGEILHMTVLIDHNAVDGAPMARFVDSLTKNIEGGIGL